jgi:hypothetical protein
MPHKKVLARIKVGDFEILVRNEEQYQKILNVLKMPNLNPIQNQASTQEKKEKLEV